MSTVSILEALQVFLTEKVAPAIQLQAGDDGSVQRYKLVHPAVHIGWLPPKGYLPVGMEAAIPCLVVGMDEGSDDRSDSELNIRISAVTFSPGLHIPAGEGVDFTPDFTGYHDLLNLIDRTVAELAKHQVVGNMVSIRDPIKWGIYEEFPYPYWYGWITCTVRRKPYPRVEAEKLLL